MHGTRLKLLFNHMITLLLLIFIPFYASAKNKSTKTRKTGQVGYFYRVKGKKYSVLTRKAAFHYSTKGTASWYGGKFHGRKAANGSRYNMNAMTAASKTLPLGSKVKVTNLSNHKTITVKITDRGPFIRGRIIDLSAKAAQKLGFKQKGITQVKIEVIAV